MIFSDCILPLDFLALPSSIQSGSNYSIATKVAGLHIDDTIVDNQLGMAQDDDEEASCRMKIWMRSF